MAPRSLTGCSSLPPKGAAFHLGGAPGWNIAPPLSAVGQLAAEAADTDAGDALIDRYHFLRGFAASHAEAAAIYRAID